MKFILLLMFYIPATGTITGVTTAEFDDLAACRAAEYAAVKMVTKVGDRHSYITECLPKSSVAAPLKK